MVSTHSQYITDFTPSSTMEAGKSPLAMLAKTCETIGLPDTPSKKSPADKKEPSPETKKVDSPSDRRKERSPRATPSTSKAEPNTSTTFPGLPKPSFPLGFPPAMPFPFGYPTMMPYPMPAFPTFPMAHFMGRVPCPSALLQRPCVTPGCTSCSAPDMMSSFAAHPLFSAYTSMMPSASSASSLPASYQSLLAASAASATASQSKHTCSWVESSGICGKQFNTADDLASHVKSAHTPSPPSSASSVTPDTSKTPLSRPGFPRFHPYSKPSSLPMPMAPIMSFPSAIQAMYTQRLMSSIPHP
uniref:C2H2-type domain-containing protein n=1 Tax=Heterorhabditis bacteriophora TaxID=37862 RepID=A0A1I7WMQ9_HETBA